MAVVPVAPSRALWFPTALYLCQHRDLLNVRASSTLHTQRVCSVLDLGCDQQHKPRSLVGEHLLTIGLIRDLFALLISRLFSGHGAKTDAGPRSRDKPKWHGVKQRQRISEHSCSGFRNTGPTERPFRNSLSGVQLVEQRLSLLQIKRVEAFGEPAVNRSE